MRRACEHGNLVRPSVGGMNHLPCTICFVSLKLNVMILVGTLIWVSFRVPYWPSEG